MLCPERRRLLVAYRDAVFKYSAAAGALYNKGGAILGSDADVLMNACRTAAQQAERARLAIQTHVAEHCCGFAEHDGL